jgi:hypothetical protein
MLHATKFAAHAGLETCDTAGLETCDTAGLETCATSQAPSHRVVYPDAQAVNRQKLATKAADKGLKTQLLGQARISPEIPCQPSRGEL